jgi:hypothetical protein
MKKTLTTIALAGLACGAFAQGTLLFDNNNSGIITVQAPGTPDAFSVADSSKNPGSAVWNVALLYAPSTAALGLAQSAFTGAAVADYIPSATVNPGIDTSGSFQDGAAGKEATITVPFDTANTFEVVSWLGTATTFAGALAGGATYTGASAEFDFTPANPNATPVPGIPSSVNGAGAWNGSLTLVPIPEPSTIALGGLGAAALMMFRRRK